MDDASIREIIRSILHPQSQDSASLMARYGNRVTRAAIFGTFVVAVERRFGAAADAGRVSGGVADYVAQLRERLANANEFNPLLAETLIRSALGEEGIASEHPLDDVVATEVFLAGAIVEDERMSEVELDCFVSEVADLVIEGLGDAQLA